MSCWVYILHSELSNRYYIGSSGNPEQRLVEHNSGKTKSIKAYVPWKIVFKQIFSDRKIARSVEARLKRYKSRTIVEKIVKDGYILGP